MCGAGVEVLAASTPETDSQDKASAFFPAPNSRVAGKLRKDERGLPQRLPQLDVLRFVAILLVLGHHPAVKIKDMDDAGPVVGTIAVAWHAAGWTGVDLFFVLSGFLIGGLLFAEMRAHRTLDVRRFLIRRGFKIWPSYYFYLFVMLVFVVCVGLSPSSMVPYFFHVQNYSENQVAFHTWSLAVEEHFYLVVPILLAFLTPRPGSVTMVAGFVFLAVTCALLRANQEGGQTHLRIDSLAFGVLLAYVFHFHREKFDRVAHYRILLLLLGLSVVVLSLMPGLLPKVCFFPLTPLGLYVGYGAILTAMMAMPTAWFQGRLTRILMLIGIYSYPIYLWHMDCAFRIIFNLSETTLVQAIPTWVRWLVGMFCYVVLASVTGIVLSRLIETPALALRDRLFPRKSDPIDAVRG
jgi:peptidoglycan/LPS O-acetylase OafA/YrhL